MWREKMSLILKFMDSYSIKLYWTLLEFVKNPIINKKFKRNCLEWGTYILDYEYSVWLLAEDKKSIKLLHTFIYTVW